MQATFAGRAAQPLSPASPFNSLLVRSRVQDLSAAADQDRRNVPDEAAQASLGVQPAAY